MAIQELNLITEFIMGTEYYISFTCGYGCRVSAICIEDALIVAKPYAIEKGYSRPSVKSIKMLEENQGAPGQPYNSDYAMVPDNITCLLIQTFKPTL